MTPDENHIIDKWHALNALTDTAAQYGLSHRTLGVLKALLSFLPGRLIHPMPGEAIVFPSNRTLSHRLNGMPESTLRRHLAQLVSAGVVSRYDSPNRKRYARGSGQGGVAFGFDLSPLARQGARLLEQATRAQEERQALAALRAKLGALRHALLERDGTAGLTEDARKALRRKPVAAELEHLCTLIETRLTKDDPQKMSAPDARNERHIQASNQYNSDSKTPQANAEQTKKTKPVVARNGQATNELELTLQHVTESCQEFSSFFPDPVRHWDDLIRIADRLTTMLGIDTHVFQEAICEMGARKAAVSVLCVLENLGQIRNPGGYLRRLTQNARAGGFDVTPMLDAACNARKLSADNSKNCLKPIC